MKIVGPIWTDSAVEVELQAVFCYVPLPLQQFQT